MTGSIYVLRNKTNGKCYVGQTTKPVEKRGIPRSEEAKENIRAGIAAAKARRRENDQ